MKKTFLVLFLVVLSLNASAVEKAFFFHGSKEHYKVDSFETTVEAIKSQLENGILGHSSSRTVDVRVEEHESLDFGSNIDIKPEVTGDGHFSLILRVTEKGLSNAVGIIEALSLLKTIHNTQIFNAPLEFFELLYNVEAKHFPALKVLVNLRKHALTNVPSLSSTFIPVETLEKVKAKLQTVRLQAIEKWESSFSAELTTFEKAQRTAERKRKNYLKAQGLDNKSAYQFNTAIAANDREGAVELLDTYLPWEQYTPFEEKMYLIMLGAMSNPVEVKYRIMMYRGIGDDRVYKGDNGEDYQMPPVLVKNQGTFNRRLRSLQTMHDKYISQNRSSNSTDYSKATRISTMLHNHMRQPKGSPFRSLTPDIRVARNFGPKQIIGFVVDPRVIIPNYMSTYKSELEFLVPFTTFPDEHAGTIEKVDYTSDNEGNEANLFNQLTEKLKNFMSISKANSAVEKVKDAVIYSYTDGLKLDGKEFTKKARVFFANYLIYSKDEMLDDTFFFNNVFSN